MSRANFFYLLAASVILVACIYSLLNWLAPRSDQLFGDYSARLNRVLNINITAPQTTRTLTPFSWRDYQQPEPLLQLSLLDSVGLKQCGLDQVIFDGNSSLGKHAAADYQLVWHTKIIQGIAACIQGKQLEPKLEDTLTVILNKKIQSVDLYWGNYLVNEQSLRYLWQSDHALRQQPYSAYQSLANNLSYLNKLQQQLIEDQNLDHEGLLALSESFAKGPSIFALLQEMQRSSLWLNEISTALEKLEFNCKNDRKNGIVLKNILHKVYMEKVQGYLAELDQSVRLLLPPLTALYHSQKSSFLLMTTKKIHLDFQESNRQHVKQWQLILDSCKA
ncbi:DUF3080 family protein [Agarivorans sp. 1_MG-2023]|uniref:DUF3080 family protein n=1 Tax=Agarivorans sp. 1_MG-2023 TaxID=3062634 RepID=UPI0026E45CA5|nr:DUF3080 family protein [Agarivorans sp. 1_MG-2023]MDO6762267.1 DUF3080 family protein [Agarivorans sp. 1_MG-2023]